MKNGFITIAEASARLGVTTQALYKSKKYQPYIAKDRTGHSFFQEAAIELLQPGATINATNEPTKDNQPLQNLSPNDPTAVLIAELRSQIAELKADKAQLISEKERLSAQFEETLKESRRAESEMRLLLNAEQQKNTMLLQAANNQAKPTNAPTNATQSFATDAEPSAKAAERAQEGRKTAQGNSAPNPTKTAQRPPQRPSQAQHKQRSFLDLLFGTGNKK